MESPVAGAHFNDGFYKAHITSEFIGLKIRLRDLEYI